MLSILSPARCASSTVSRAVVGVKIAADDERALLRKADRRGAPLAAAGARDQRNLAVEPTAHRSNPNGC